MYNVPIKISNIIDEFIQGVNKIPFYMNVQKEGIILKE